MRSDIAISVRSLTKTYRIFGHPGDRIKQALTLGRVRFHREFTALQDISFEIKKGETVGIIGRNGSGKSTLLQLICGILKPTSGVVQVNGRISALLELGSGFNPEFTGRENVYFQGAVMGFSREYMKNRFDDIAAFSDIGEFIDQPVRTYSSGMYVRLAFATAINTDPDILIVDEALSVGDAQFQAKCFGKFREFQDKGVTILFITHSLDLIAAHCERAILLDRGILIESSAPKQAIDTYRQLLTTQQGEEVSSIPSPDVSHSLLWQNIFKHNPSEARYGSRDTEIIEAGLFATDGKASQILPQGDECLVKIRLVSHLSGAHPFVSYVIKDLKGMPLCGTTTLMEGLSLDVTRSGQILTITFRQPILLNPGHYLLSVGSQSHDINDRIIAHDHRSDYLPFEVTGKSRYGVFAAPISVSCESEFLA